MNDRNQIIKELDNEINNYESKIKDCKLKLKQLVKQEMEHKYYKHNDQAIYIYVIRIEEEYPYGVYVFKIIHETYSSIYYTSIYDVSSYTEISKKEFIEQFIIGRKRIEAIIE